MKKLKSYLGLLFIVSLLIFSYSQSKSSYGFGKKPTERINFLDRNNITKIGLSISSDWKLWNFVTGFIANCENRENQTLKYTQAPQCGRLGEYIRNNVYLLKDNIQDFINLEPEIENKIKELERLQGPNAYFFPNKPKENNIEKEINNKLNYLTSKAALKKTEKIKSSLAVKIILINFIFIVFCFIGIFYRHLLGGIILYPFSLVGRLIYRTANQVKKIHEKI